MLAVVVSTFLAALSLVSPATTIQDWLGPPDVFVRVYAQPAMAAPDLRAVLTAAAVILYDTGARVEWVMCPARAGDAIASTDHRCEVPLAPNELVLRLVRGHTPSAYRGVLPLGGSLIDTEQGHGTLATVFLDRVDWLADAGRIQPAALAARVVAHEVVHLLLGTHDHTPRGLMRAVWTRDEVRRGRPADWQTPPEQRKAIVAALSLLGSADLIARAAD
jgi:hypothetical protein